MNKVMKIILQCSKGHIFVAAGLLAGIWTAASALGNQFDPGLLLTFCAVAGLYFLFTRHEEKESNDSTLKPVTAWLLLGYVVLYLVAIFFIHLLAASIVLWLVQFTIPLIIIKIRKQPLSSIGFSFKAIFKKAWIWLLACAGMTPFFVFAVRDSEMILPMISTGTFFIYLPLSVLSMLAMVTFCEEFFFRGAVLFAGLPIFRQPAWAVAISAILFAAYHLPMRYFNERSPFFQDLKGALGTVFSEHLIMGALLAFVVIRTRNVWHAIWIHAFFNGLSSVYQLSLKIQF
jgi:membrane protease YdiL (CAAX protease family)